MKDRIVAAMMADFSKEQSLQGAAESEQFEALVNYCLISQHYSAHFEPHDVATGGGGDLGIDGIAVLVNDQLVFDSAAVDHLKSTQRRLDAHFVFVQAKTSNSFDGSDIGTFASGVRNFLSSRLPDYANGELRSLHALKEHIFAAAIDMERSPACTLYFATTGVWTADASLQSRADLGVADIRALGLFRSVAFVPVDADYLKSIFRSLRHGTEAAFTFEKHTILPTITGVQESYLGIVPAREYLKLLSGDGGALNRRLFYDNVRDYQGLNAVNQEIAAALAAPDTSDRFALLNNGITVVARGLVKVGTTFRLKNYQIVNGCQTSHVLFLNRDKLTSSVQLPMKLIVTEDIEITSQIIQGTNRQTEVKLEAFESVRPFHKELEEFYQAASRSLPEPIFYERRSKQYDALEVRRDQVVTLGTQIQCFLAMFHNAPQSHARYYGELLATNRARLFVENHRPHPYFASGACLTMLDRLFYKGLLRREWKPFRFQILLGFRVRVAGNDMPQASSPKIEAYSQKLLDVLRNEAAAVAEFTAVAEIVARACSELPLSQEPAYRTKALTERLLHLLSAPELALPQGDRTRATLRTYSSVQSYGFLVGDDGQKVFLALSQILNLKPGRVPQVGDLFEYELKESKQGLKAVNARLVR